MAVSSQYVSAPTLDVSVGATANGGRDGTGTLVLAASGPAAVAGAGVGKRISRATVKATGTNIAGMVRFFVSTDGGVTSRLLTEVPVTATTPSASVASFEATVPNVVGLVLPDANARVYWSTNNAEQFVVTVEGGLM